MVSAVEVLVGSNSIQCTSCQKLGHKKCSGIKGSMSKVMAIYMLLEFSNQCKSNKCRYWCQCKLVLVDKFCYLGDMLSVEWIEMLMQLWTPESELDRINSGNWYYCLLIRIYH